MSQNLAVKVSLTTFLLFGMSCHALGFTSIGNHGKQSMMNSSPGFYIGIMGGWASTHWSNVEDIDNKWVADVDIEASSGAIGWRPFIGYDINQYFAIEGGYTHIHGEDFKIYNRPGNMLYFKDRVSEDAFDANLKMKVPLTCAINLFAKFGAVYLRVSNAVKHTDGIDPADGAVPRFKRDGRTSFNTMFAVGATYCISPRVKADIAWTHYRGNADWGNYFIPDVSFFTVGLIYKFCH